MSNIQVLSAISIPYKLDPKTYKWVGTTQHSWPIKSDFVVDFGLEADTKIRKKVKNFGKIRYPFKPKTLAKSLESHIANSDSYTFENFVETIQLETPISLEASRAKSKLVLIFIKYELVLNDGEDRKTYFVVVMLKDKSALRFNEHGAPQGTEIIDFDDVMQAATIILDDFTVSSTNNEDCDVAFINNATNYFIDFFDAEEVIKNKESVSNLLRALPDYCSANNLGRSAREKVESRIKSTLDYNERKKLPTKLQDISNVVYNSLKEELGEKNNEPSSFQNFVKSYNYKINDEFTVPLSDRDKLDYISFETAVGNLKLKKALIGGQSREDQIQFNGNTYELHLKTKIQDPEIISELAKIQNDH